MNLDFDPELKRHIERTVDEFLPDFLARIEKPHKQYALTYALARITKILAESIPAECISERIEAEANNEWLQALTRPEALEPSKERSLRSTLKKRNRANKLL